MDFLSNITNIFKPAVDTVKKTVNTAKNFVWDKIGGTDAKPSYTAPVKFGETKTNLYYSNRQKQTAAIAGWLYDTSKVVMKADVPTPTNPIGKPWEERTAKEKSQNALYEAFQNPMTKSVLNFREGLTQDASETDLPWVGHAFEYTDLYEVYGSYKAFEDGTDTDEDAFIVNEYLEELEYFQAKRDESNAYRIGEGVRQSATFGVELFTSGGVGGAIKKGVTKAADKYIAKKVLTETVQTGLKAKLKKKAGDVALDTLITGAASVPPLTLEKQIGYVNTETGEIIEAGQPLGEAVKNAISQHTVEIVSERGGGASWLMLKKMGKPAQNAITKMAIYNGIKKKMPNLTNKQLNSIFEKAGWNGMIGEFSEERDAQILNAALFELGLGDQEFQMLTKDDLITEVGMILTMGTAMRAAQVAANKIAGNEGGQLEFIDLSTGQPITMEEAIAADGAALGMGDIAEQVADTQAGIAVSTGAVALAEATAQPAQLTNNLLNQPKDEVDSITAVRYENKTIERMAEDIANKAVESVQPANDKLASMPPITQAKKDAIDKEFETEIEEETRAKEQREEITRNDTTTVRTLNNRIATYEDSLATANFAARPLIKARIKKLETARDAAIGDLGVNTYINSEGVADQVAAIPFAKDIRFKEMLSFMESEGRKKGKAVLGRQYLDIIEYIKNPHKTTIPHEAFHAFLRVVAPEMRKEALAIIMSKQNVSEAKAEELLAQGFAEWFVSEQRPTTRLQQIFEYIKNKMLQLVGGQSDLEALYSEVISPFKSVRGKFIIPVGTTIHEVREEMYQNPVGYTFKLFSDEVFTKTEVKREELLGAIKSKKANLKPGEKALMLSVIESEQFKKADKIKTEEFNRAVYDEALVFKIIPSTAHDDAGLDSIERLYVEAVSYVINTNFLHEGGKTIGQVHFSGLFNEMDASNLAIKTVDAGTYTTAEGQTIVTTSPRYFVVDKAAATQEDLETGGVFDSFKDREAAAEYIKNFDERIIHEAGMLGHVRIFKENGEWFVPEIQSDVFQQKSLEFLFRSNEQFIQNELKEHQELLRKASLYKKLNKEIKKFGIEVGQGAVSDKSFDNLMKISDSFMNAEGKYVIDAKIIRNFVELMQAEPVPDMEIAFNSYMETSKELSEETINTMQIKLKEEYATAEQKIRDSYDDGNKYYSKNLYAKALDSIYGITHWLENFEAYINITTGDITGFKATLNEDGVAKVPELLAENVTPETIESLQEFLTDDYKLNNDLFKDEIKNVEEAYLIFAAAKDKSLEFSSGEFGKKEDESIDAYKKRKEVFKKNLEAENEAREIYREAKKTLHEKLRPVSAIVDKTLEEAKATVMATVSTDLTPEQKHQVDLSEQFMRYKNREYEMLIKQVIRLAALDGASHVNFATPSTVAKVEWNHKGEEDDYSYGMIKKEDVFVGQEDEGVHGYGAIVVSFDDDGYTLAESEESLQVVSADDFISDESNRFYDEFEDRDFLIGEDNFVEHVLAILSDELTIGQFKTIEEKGLTASELLEDESTKDIAADAKNEIIEKEIDALDVEELLESYDYKFVKLDGRDEYAISIGEEIYEQYYEFAGTSNEDYADEFEIGHIDSESHQVIAAKYGMYTDPDTGKERTGRYLEYLLKIRNNMELDWKDEEGFTWNRTALSPSDKADVLSYQTEDMIEDGGKKASDDLVFKNKKNVVGANAFDIETYEDTKLYILENGIESANTYFDKPVNHTIGGYNRYGEIQDMLPIKENTAANAMDYETVDEYVNSFPTVFHGSDVAIDKINFAMGGANTKAANATKGVFFTSNYIVAEDYGQLANKNKGVDLVKEGLDGKVKILEVKFGGNVKIINEKGADRIPGNYNKYLDNAKKEGYDALIIRNTIDSPYNFNNVMQDNYIAFNDKAILKDADLRETWEKAQQNKVVEDKPVVTKVTAVEKIPSNYATRYPKAYENTIANLEGANEEIATKVLDHMLADTVPSREDTLVFDLYIHTHNQLRNKIGLKAIDFTVTPEERDAAKQKAMSVFAGMKTQKDREVPAYAKKSSKKNTAAAEKEKQREAIKRSAYDKLAQGNVDTQSGELQAMLINKVQQDALDEVVNNAPKRTLELMKMNTKKMTEVVKTQQKKADVIYGVYYQKMKAVMIKFNETDDIKDAPTWYKRYVNKNEKKKHKMTIEEFEKEVEKQIKLDATTLQNDTGKVDPDAAEYMRLTDSIQTLEARIEGNIRALESTKKSGTTAKYIELANAKEPLLKAKRELESMARKDATIKSAQAVVTREKLMQDETYAKAFNNLRGETKALYLTDTAAFMESYDDPYIVQAKSGHITLIEAELMNDTKYKDHKILHIIAKDADDANVEKDVYFAKYIIEDKKIRQHEAEIKVMQAELLNTDTYIELLKDIQTINNKQNELVSKYKSTDELLMAMHKQDMRAAVKFSREMSKIELAEQKRVAQAAIKQAKKEGRELNAATIKNFRDLNNAKIQKTLERKKILATYEKTYNVQFGADLHENLLAPKKKSLKASKSFVTGKAAWENMTDAEFDALLEKKLLPILEHANRVTYVYNNINLYIDANEIKNSKQLMKAMELTRVPSLEGKITSIEQLETLNIKELTLFLEIVRKFGRNTVFLPAGQLEPQFRAALADETLTSETFLDGIMFTQEDFYAMHIEEFERITGKKLTPEQAIVQIRMFKKGFSTFDKTKGLGHLRHKNSMVGAVANRLMAMEVIAKQRHKDTMDVVEAAYKKARESRDSSFIFSDKVTTNEIVFNLLDDKSTPEERAAIIAGESRFGKPTEEELAYHKLLRELYDEVGMEVSYVNGMPLRENYARHSAKKLDEYIRESTWIGPLKFINGYVKYLKRETTVKQSFFDLTKPNGKYNLLSSRSHFQAARARTGALEDLSTDVFRVTNEYMREAYLFLETSKELPRLTAYIEIAMLSEGEEVEGTDEVKFTKTKKASKIQKFIGQRVDLIRGIKPEVLGVEQGGKVDKVLRGTRTALTLKLLGFRYGRQTISNTSELIQAGNAAGWKKSIQALFRNKKVEDTQEDVKKQLGIDLSKQQAINTNKLVAENSALIGTTMVDDLFAEGQTSFKKGTSVALAGYAFFTAQINEMHFIALLSEEAKNTGVLSREELAEIVLDMSSDRYLSGFSESPLGATSPSKLIFQFLHWALALMYTSLDAVKMNSLLVLDAATKGERTANRRGVDVASTNFKMLKHGITAMTIFAILQWLFENWFPDDEADYNMAQKAVSWTMEEAATMPSSIGMFVVHTYVLGRTLVTGITAGQNLEDDMDRDSWDYVRKANRSSIEKTVDMLLPYKTSSGTIITDDFSKLITRVVGNYYYGLTKYDISTEPYNKRVKSESERKEAMEKGHYNAYLWMQPVAWKNAAEFSEWLDEESQFADQISTWSLEPKMITAKKKDRALSEELLGHPFGMDTKADSAVLYEQQKSMTAQQKAAEIQALESSDQVKDNRMAEDLKLFYANQPYDKTEKQVLSGLTAKHLKGPNRYERQTDNSVGTALNFYMQGLKNEDEAIDFVTRLIKTHVATELITAAAIANGLQQYNIGITFKPEELEFMQIEPGEQRGEAVAEYIESTDANMSEAAEMLTAYIIGGFIHHDEELQYMEAWLTETYRVK